MFANQKSKLWMLFLFLVASCLLVLVVRQINRPPVQKVPSFSSAEELIKEKGISQKAANPAEAPADFPAPAKKLHKVIHDPGDKEITKDELDERIQKLNVELAEIKEKLEKQGLELPAKPEVTNEGSSETANRLQAIKEHLAKN